MKRTGWNLPKPLWVATIAGILLLVLQFGIGGSFLSSRLESQGFERKQGELATGRQQLKKNASRYQYQAEAMAANPALVPFQGRDGIQLQKVEEAHGMFRPEKPIITLLSVDGHPVETNQSGPVPNQIGQTKAFRAALNGHASCSNPHLLGGRKGLIIAIYHPLRDQQGTIQRVARQYVLLRDLAPEIESEGHFIWLDKHGDVLLGKDLEPLSDFSQQAEGWSPNQDQGIYTDTASGKPLYYVQAPLDDLALVPGGQLLFVTPATVVLATMGPLRQLLLGSVGLLLILTLIVALWLRYRRPAVPDTALATRTLDQDGLSTDPVPTWWAEYSDRTRSTPCSNTVNAFGGSNPPPWRQPPEVPGHELLEVIGCGGFGCVFRARQNSLDRIVAIKVLFPQLAQDTKYRQRLMQEGQVLAQLEHRHIVHVLEVGGDEKTMWMSMEYIEGKTLKHHLEKGRPCERAFSILDQVCDALTFAHDKQIVHRDIKPSNILIDENGQVRVVDFGIAKVTGSPLVTATGHGMGTPGYMAPEQFSAHVPVTERADIYGLGVVAYQLVTGLKPTPGSKPPSQLNESLPQEIDELIMSCMRSEPDERPESVAWFQQELRKIIKQSVSNSPAKA